jgi:hypothetical protein
MVDNDDTSAKKISGSYVQADNMDKARDSRGGMTSPVEKKKKKVNISFGQIRKILDSMPIIWFLNCGP